MKEFYENNVTKSKQELSVLDKKINTNSLLRLGLIIGGGAVLFQVFQMNSVWILFASVFAIVLGFAFLVKRQSQLEKQRENLSAFLRVNENELQVISSSSNMYDNGVIYESGKHPYVSDLDIFGESSLFSMLNRSATKDGEERLASWLLAPSDKVTIEARQEAVAELADKREWLQDLQTKLLFNLGKQVNVKTFLERYLHDSDLKFGSRFMKIYVKVVPFVFIAGVLVSLFVQPIWNYLLLLAVVHLVWTMALGGRVSYFSSKMDKLGVTLMAYADALKMLEDESFSSTKNKDLQEQLKTSSKEKISTAFQSLGTLVDKLEVRNNILVGSFLNMLLLWDFKQVLAIIGWKNRYGADILRAFDIVAEFEALLSLAVLKSNNSTWSKPIILDDVAQRRIKAEELNHPLIKTTTAIPNSYDASSHQIALITGSNMAGKSTFLRTIGINAVLAYAGSVVYAKYFALPIYRLVSYMRIKDDLKESTSTFKAELDRMKFILKKVKEEKDAFVLIDEMLRGTNSVDKYLGSRAIIKQLIAMDGKGMVATHDLQLASLEEEYAGILKNYHFDIQVRDGEMLFDYKLKEGKCTIFNASMLLKGIGVDVDTV